MPFRNRLVGRTIVEVTEEKNLIELVFDNGYKLSMSSVLVKGADGHLYYDMEVALDFLTGTASALVGLWPRNPQTIDK